MNDIEKLYFQSVGNLPDGWIYCRNNVLYKERKEFCNANEPFSNLLSVSEYYGIAKRQEKVDDEIISRAENLDGYRRCYSNDLVMNYMLAWKGAQATTPLNGVVSPSYAVFQPSKKIVPKFAHYLYRTKLFCAIFEANSTGIIKSRLRLYPKNFLKLYSILPSFSEQKNIVAYLDLKCNDIDTIVNKHKSLIEKIEDYKRAYIISSVTGIYPNCKLKDSYIAWMPKVPAEWDIIPLRFVFGERKNKNVGLVEKNLLTLSYGKIKRKDINSNEGLLPASFEGYNIVEKGDIVMRLLDLQNDWKSLRTGLVTERGIVTSAYVTLYPKRELNSAYFRYLLHSYDLKKVFYTMGEGIRQSLKYDDIGRNLLLPIPSMEEQDKIVNAIKEVETKADMAIARHQQIIEKLEEYRKSIIYNAVTGKIDCTKEMVTNGI